MAHLEWGGGSQNRRLSVVPGIFGDYRDALAFLIDVRSA